MRRVMGRALAALSALVIGSAAWAQGPAGNAHPETQAISQGAGTEGVFGEPDWGKANAPTAERHAMTRRKVEFARRVDLSALRDLSVYHNGRVKILDTLARETVRAVCGRPTYQDFPRPEGDGGDDRKITKYNYDPLFTLLDLVIDPAYVYDKPLIHVNFLPLREAFLEQAFPADQGAALRWKKLGRISPQMVDTLGNALAERLAFEKGYDEAFPRLVQATRLVQESGKNLLVVAPDHEGEAWRGLDALPAGSPARVAALELARAWRAGDAEGVSRASEALAASLGSISPDIYAPRAGLAGFGLPRRSWESFYNRARSFEWGMWAYLVSLVSLLLAFGTGRRWLAWVGGGFLVTGVVMHGLGFWARCVIAERFAIQNQFESMTGVSLFAAIVGITMMLVRRQWLFGAAAAGVGFLVLVTATQAGIPGVHVEREAAILNTSVLLKYHVTTVLTSYGLIALAFVVSLFYLWTHYWSRAVGQGAGALAGAGLGDIGEEPSKPSSGAARTLHELDVAQMTVLQLAFWTLGVGVLLGAWWADHSWGRWWAWDPKETWALVTWIILLIIVHVRFASGPRRGITTAWLSVLGFVVMIWTYFGVNLLLPGLHAYA